MAFNTSLKMMDVNYISTRAFRSSLNETKVKINRLNSNLPSYLYREIPTVFDIIGVVLNIAIIIYFIKSRKYRNPIFTILTSLATMDTCVCLGAAMIILIFPKVVTPEYGFLCFTVFFVTVVGVVGSEYTLILFAGVRLYQVISPLKARASLTMSLMVRHCATINAISVTLCGVYAAFWRPTTTVNNGEVITLCIFYGNHYAKDLTLMIVLTAIPCFTIFLLHVLKYIAHIRSKRLVKTEQERKSPDAHAVAIVIILFYICWIPALTYVTIQQARIDDYAFLEDNIYILLGHVAYANSVMNPLVYVLAMKSIRDDVINLFCFRRQSKSR